MFRRDWRSLPQNALLLWRRSLRFRTITITLVLTSVAVFIACAVMALVIQNDLFTSRRDQALADAQRAVAAAQTTLDSADVSDDRAALRTLWQNVQGELDRVSSSDLITAFQIDPQPGDLTLSGFSSPGLTADVLSDVLRNRVVQFDTRQQWQSVALGEDGATVPGIVVGQQLVVPEVGEFEVYIAYSLADSEQTLLFVQRTLWLAGSILVALIAGISWVVLRSMSVPIVEAAETSARLAAGDLAVRITLNAEDELDTLARTFNSMADSI